MARDRRDKAEELFPFTGKTVPSRFTDDDITAYTGQDTSNPSLPLNDSVVSKPVSQELPDTLSHTTPVTEGSIASEIEPENKNDTLQVPEIQNTIIKPDSTGTISSGQGNINHSGANNNLTGNPADSLKKSVWERIEFRERQIDNSRITSSAVPVRPSPGDDEQNLTDKTFRYDAYEFLETGWYSRSDMSIFPSYSKDRNELTGTQTVFNQPNPSSINKANGAYIAYIQENTDSGISPHIQQSTTWIPALVILSLLLLAWIKLIYVQFLTPVLVSAFNYKESMKLYHGKNAPAQNAFLILNVIFAINGGLFLLFVSGFFNLELPEISTVFLFFGASACLVLLYMFKSFVLKVLGFLFDKQRLFSEYSYNISLYNKIYGLLLLPLVVGIQYGSEIVHDKIIYAGLALGGVFYLLQLYRGLEIIVRKDFSLFYLILYLCAFEIFPIMVIYQLVQAFLM
jgi:hypothetical protein